MIPMKIVDVHAHLDFEDYHADIDILTRKWAQEGVVSVVSNSVHKQSCVKNLELAKKYPLIRPAFGIYPTHCAGLHEEEFDAVLEFIRKQKMIAVGEVGLDYAVSDENPEPEAAKPVMKRCFEEFIHLAEKKKIPIIVHSRKAELEAIEMLESSSTKKIVMHCFSGRKHLVKRIVDNGWYLSIPCTVTRSQQFQENVIIQDLSKILTETDAPYLSPYPDIHRNEPSFIIESLKKIAELKRMDVIEVANNVYKNYQDLFL
ncbi:MAG: TatD family hydrolase [Nanoarchaeota archaeon]